MTSKLLAAACLFAISVSACSSSDADRTGGAGAGGAPSAGAGGASAGSAGSSGNAGSSGAAQEGFECNGAKASCDSWTTFSQATTASWGTGAFTGGVTTFGKTLVRDDSTDAIHVTGTVDDYGYGVGLFFLKCSDLSEYTGVSFDLSGTAGESNRMIVQLQTNSDYPWEAKPSDLKGTCTAADKENPFGSCVAPSTLVDIESGSVSWTDLKGGMPVSSADPAEALGLQWAFPYDGETSYEFDVTIGNVQLLGGTGVSCSARD